jgi:protein tyrosine phosphatase (PTP) superfamily phosphohydrolase (DUF442 family)
MSAALDALGGVTNAAQPAPHLLTGGQPSPAHFEALKSAGVDLILDIRHPMEPRPFDEAELVRSLGMEYINIPVTAGTLTDDTLEEILTLIRDNEPRSMLLHCASGNRVWGPVIPYLVLDRGLDSETVTGEATRSGLRGVDIMQWGLDYVRRRQNQE